LKAIAHFRALKNATTKAAEQIVPKHFHQSNQYTFKVVTRPPNALDEPYLNAYRFALSDLIYIK
jgi:hypothetical protein